LWSTVPVLYRTVKNTREDRWNSGDYSGSTDQLRAGNVFSRYMQELDD